VRIEKPVDLATLKGKPRGNVLAQAVPDSVDYSRVNAHLTLAHVRGLRTTEVAVTGEDGREASARNAVALIDVALAEEARLFRSADGPAASLLVGTWRLVDSYEARVSTQEIVRTRGRSPRGLLVYRADGGMTVQVMDDERRLFPSPQVTLEDKAAAFETYTAYFGRFEARPGESAVVHHIEGSLLPNEVGQSRLRFFALDGDRLTLTTPPFDAHGERRTRVIIWERVQ
jgi:Lipocalin-like domain